MKINRGNIFKKLIIIKINREIINSSWKSVVLSGFE